MRAAFDLDGVLAEVVDSGLFVKKWRFMTGEERKSRGLALEAFYERAEALYEPKVGAFDVITARKDTVTVRRITEAWLERHFAGRVRSLHMLRGSRTVENVLTFKRGVIQTLGVTEFTEDNPHIVRGLRRSLVGVRVWHFDGIFASMGGPW